MLTICYTTASYSLSGFMKLGLVCHLDFKISIVIQSDGEELIRLKEILSTGKINTPCPSLDVNKIETHLFKH